MPRINTIILNTNGNISNVSIKTNNLDINNIDNKFIKNILFRTGTNELERHCDWELEDGIIVSIFAWDNGSIKNLNKHELPPPSDNILLYGDILVIKTKSGKFCNISFEEYNQFYEMAFGGFEDLGSEDSEYSDDSDYDKTDSFIASDNEILEVSSQSTTESEYVDSNEDDTDSNEDDTDSNEDDTDSEYVDSNEDDTESDK